MYEDMLTDFINNGGIEKIGHQAFALLAFLVDKAKANNYPDVLEISVRESSYKTKLGVKMALPRAREKLLSEDLIKSYEPKGDIGFYYLNYKPQF